MSDNGKFVWHDLMTTDLAASHRFYTALFGWKSDEATIDEKTHYVHLKAGSAHIGGMIPLDKTHGIPPHWIGYVAAEDVDGTVEKAKSLGARLHAGPTDIDVGRFAVMSDPEGAAFAVFHYTKPSGATGDSSSSAQQPPAPGNFCWDELYAKDVDQAKTFYTKVHGWKTTGMEMPGMGTYHLYHSGDKQVAGMMPLMPNMSPVPFWLPYVAVSNSDETAEHATKLGAHVVMQPMNIPNVGRFAVILDPLRAAFGILGPNK